MHSVDESDENEYTSMLWEAEVVSQTSKLGSFMTAFRDFYKQDDEKADNTDNWVGHEVRINSWVRGNREVRVTE